MKPAELFKQLKRIRHERLMDTHHDMLLKSYPDIETLNAFINLMRFLDKKKPSDTLTVAELFEQLKETDTF